VALKRTLWAVIAAVIIIVIILSLFVYINSQKPYTGNIESITIGTIAHETYSLIYTAIDQQYFINNGLNVTLKYYPNGAATVNGLLNGESEIATASEFILAGQALQNASIYSLATIAKATNLYLVASADKGISNISDLKGKTIGVNFGSNSQYYLGTFLQQNGIDTSQVTLVNINPLNPSSVLTNGTVDAVVTLQPFIGQIQSLLGNNTVLFAIQSNQPSYYEAISTKTWTAANPDLVQRFLKAIVQAETFNTEHPDQAMAIITKNLNYTSSYTATVWPDYQFSVSLDQSFLLLMQNEARWLISNNLTNATSVPNFLNYIYLDGLRVVKPESVNILG
jgi:ABC-type nitrate/sulfonate/bicarbonate transport system substrate-binding protein